MTFGVRWTRVAAVLLLVATTAVVHASVASADTTYNETTGGVVHTWTNYANAGGTEGPAIPNNQTVQIECTVTGFPVSNGNTHWYLIASSPWNAQFYASADAFYNDGATSGSLVGTPWLDPAVPVCGGTRTPPTSSAPPPPPSVSLAQGPAAPYGYRYAVTLAGFPANTAVSVVCDDSLSSDFWSFTLQTDGAGDAFTQNECYSAQGPQHWVVADGVESNHVAWGSSASTSVNTAAPTGGAVNTSPAGSSSPGSSTYVAPPMTDAQPSGDIPFPTVPAPGPLPKAGSPSVATRIRYSGDLAEMQGLLAFCLDFNFHNCYQAGAHYIGASGQTQQYSMTDLYKGVPGLAAQFQYWLRDNVTRAVSALSATGSNSAVVVKFDTAGSTQNWYDFDDTDLASDWYWALHRFSIRMVGSVWVGPAAADGSRPLQIQYRSFAFDVYNFDPKGEYGNLEDLAVHGLAAEFLETSESNTITLNTTLSAVAPNSLVPQT